MLLLDINVWLSLAFQKHAQHSAALNWFESVSEAPCCFCRQTQLGFLRLASNRQVWGDSAVTLPRAWESYERLLNDPRVAYCEEPIGLEAVWKSLTQRQSFSPKIWSDAYLAAFAQLGGLQIVTFDNGFSQFSAARCLILK